MSNKFRLIFEVLIMAMLIVGSVIYGQVSNYGSYHDLIVLGIVVTLITIIIAFSTSWFYAQPKDAIHELKNIIESLRSDSDNSKNLAINELKDESIELLKGYEDKTKLLHQKIDSTLSDFVESQPFVDEDMLSVIEENAAAVWVVSTDLSNDVNPGRIRDSVEKNLREGKHYTYFIPSPGNASFSDAQEHERTYKSWSVYLQHKEQVNFIHLPEDTLFLFKEIVIYNPLINPDKADSTNKPKGFTYFDTSPNDRDRLMKIPESFLHFIRSQLNRYFQDTGLTFEIQTLIPEIKSSLSHESIGYLASLFGESRVKDIEKYDKFLRKVKETNPDIGNIIEKRLSKYIEKY